MSRWILKSRFSWVQWASTVLLISGSVQLQSAACDPSAGEAVSQLQPGPHDAVNDKRIFGVAITMVICLSSAAAGVYSQSLLTTEESINLCNIKLYGFGVLVNLVAFAFDTSDVTMTTADSDGSLTSYGLAYIVNLTFLGIVISRILKHAGAIVKLFSYAASTVLIYFYSAYLGFPQRTSAATTLFAGVSIFVGLFVFTLSPEPPRKETPRPAADLFLREPQPPTKTTVNRT